MNQENTSTNGGKDEETYKDGALLEEEKIDGEISVKGAESLTNQELLAVILSGDREALTAADLLNTFDNNLVHLFCASFNQLMETDGIGLQEAQEIKAVFELTKRIAAYCEEDHPKITSKDDVTKLLASHMMFLPQEEFKVILLNAKQKLIRVETVSLGSLDKALVEPRDVFRPAITFNAASLVIVHNHPSGDTQPSEQDVLLTRELCMCGMILGIEVLDHIIISVRDHVSFKERTLITLFQLNKGLALAFPLGFYKSIPIETNEAQI
ncbi:MAG: DNA repair protein RadC [Theionarchaea archaeon]|nr:DNA repair protein RadC [Theionarchaea archaeon]